jgi:hypothetical protein
MGIKGLTDRGLSFPEIGQIRKGAPKIDPKKPGADLTYFRVTFDEREAERERLFRSKYGPEPREINILLPFNEISQVWDACYEAYTAGRMVARSDGEKMIYQLDAQTGEVLVLGGEPYKPHPKGGVVGEYITQDGRSEQIRLKPTGRLKVVIPELQSLAYLVVLTTSIHDIRNISEQLEGLKLLNGGQIAGIPLILRRRPKKISTPTSDGGRARRSKWLLSIEANPAWVAAKLADMKRLALPDDKLPILPEGLAKIELDHAGDCSCSSEEEDVDETELEELDIMTIEEAEYEISTSTGQLYGTIPTEELTHRLNSMLKVKNPTTEQLRKINAARIIIQARAEGRPVMTPD